MGRALPAFAPLGDGRVSCRATVVVSKGRALAICGPSGSGKSGTAAQMIALGAGLVADDLAVLSADGYRLKASAPVGAPTAIELRGLGIIPIALAGPADLAAFLYLGAGAARLPEPEMIEVCERPVAMLRHPASPDLAAKLMLWLAARGAAEC